MTCRWAAVLATALVASFAGAGPASAAENYCGLGTCSRSGNGVEVAGWDQSSRTRPGAGGRAGGAAAPAARTTESTRTPGCAGNDPNVGGAYDQACAQMVTYCATVGRSGWLVWIWTRPLPAAGGSSPRWTWTAATCVAPAAAGVATRPAVTQAVIRRAFARLPFALPYPHIQPEGNLTLVNLPTFYQATWPGRGRTPGQTARVTLLGRDLSFRLVAAYRYSFGDGQRMGPTSDAGGPYPDGGVRHTYTRTGTMPVRITADYTADFSLDGTTWTPVGLTVPVTGPPVDLVVRQARNRLQASRP